MRRRDLYVLVPDEIEINRLPLGAVRIPVVAFSRNGAGFVTSVSASALGRTQETKLRSPLTGLCLRPEDVESGLDEPDAEVVAEVSGHASCQNIYLDLSGAQMDDGGRVPLTIKVEAVISGRAISETVRIPLRAASLPHVPGWCGGDGHVHTWWSPDVILLPIAERARFARDNGFGFLVITDHEDGIGRNWGTAEGYCAQCRAAEEEYGLPVLPGVEIAAAGGGHCLAYRMSESAASVPANRRLPAGDLLLAIEAHNHPHSYGIAAHPFEKRERWVDWDAQGLAGIELINRSREARRETVSQWFSLLNRDAAKTLQTGRFVVGLANSDCHNFQEPGGRGFTWVGSAPLNSITVWETIRNGRAVASGSKDLGFFSLNGTEIGNIARAEPGSVLAFDIQHHPAAGRRCRRITVYSGNGKEAVLAPGKPGVPFRYETRCPRSSTFYVLRFDFAGNGRRKDSEAWTNPVFVQAGGF